MSGEHPCRPGLALGGGIGGAGRQANQPWFGPDESDFGSAAAVGKRTQSYGDVRLTGRRALPFGNQLADELKRQRDKLRTSIVIGIISDTHGLLRPEALEALRDSHHIIHAGDVGAYEILEQLGRVAPVTAIRGNIDKAPWARKLSETEVVELAGVSIYVLHDLAQLDLNAEAAGFRVVISGHSHAAKQETRNGVLYFNPGSAGPRRFKLPVTVGKLTVSDGEIVGEILPILP